MQKKITQVIVLAAFLGLSISAHATLIDNGSFTTDPDNGLDWLDLTQTKDMSYNYVSSRMGAGGDFAGWRYATGAEVASLWTAAGGNPLYYNGLSTQNDGLWGTLGPLWGDLFCGITGCAPGMGGGIAMLGEPVAGNYKTVALMENYSPAVDWFVNYDAPIHVMNHRRGMGAALVRGTQEQPAPEPQTVPEPPTVLLLSAGLLGLLGFKRRNYRKYS